MMKNDVTVKAIEAVRLLIDCWISRNGVTGIMPPARNVANITTPLDRMLEPLFEEPKFLFLHCVKQSLLIIDNSVNNHVNFIVGEGGLFLVDVASPFLLYLGDLLISCSSFLISLW
ncbi:MAG: hypothetical protein M1503_10480 [Thaumarchaeota archaeon]|nr:hypothetical protein [Nitrososphaerota archaeon]MCL5318666.1 hypothetical protein [Nitrososphaerota archaeon]